MTQELSRSQLIFRALASRNYRLFFTGNGISLIGNWMTQLATIWLVYQLTNSPLWLGIVGFSSQVPSFFLSPFGGVIVDRFSRHRILIYTQALAMSQSLMLAVLALTHTANIWHIVILSLFQGLINAIDAPARQAFVPEIVENKENLSSAIALNSSMFSSARLIGPAIAGLLVAKVGSGICFLIDGLSYIPVLAALMAINLPAQETLLVDSNPLERLKAGIDYAWGFPPIRAVLMLMAVVSCFGMSYTALAPIFAKEILGGGAETLGFLMAGSGVGALSSGLYLGSRPSVLGIGKILAAAPAIMGAGVIVFSRSRLLWLSLLAMFAIGFGFTLQLASANTFLQTVVEDDKRGRVMSLYVMCFIGTIPFGNLLAGVIASRIGSPNTLLISGICCLFAALIFAKQLPQLRQFTIPVYTKLGILPASNTNSRSS